MPKYAKLIDFGQSEFICNLDSEGQCVMNCNFEKSCGSRTSKFVCTAPHCQCNGDGCQRINQSFAIASTTIHPLISSTMQNDGIVWTSSSDSLDEVILFSKKEEVNGSYYLMIFGIMAFIMAFGCFIFVCLRRRLWYDDTARNDIKVSLDLGLHAVEPDEEFDVETVRDMTTTEQVENSEDSGLIETIADDDISNTKCVNGCGGEGNDEYSSDPSGLYTLYTSI